MTSRDDALGSCRYIICPHCHGTCEWEAFDGSTVRVPRHLRRRVMGGWRWLPCLGSWRRVPSEEVIPF